MSTCDTIWELMNLELDDQLTAEESQQLNSHRATCSQCNLLSKQLQAMHTALTDIGEADPPTGFTQRVMEKIHEEHNISTPKVIPFRKKIMRYSSAVAVVALSFALYQGQMRQSNIPSDMPAVVRGSASTPVTAEPDGGDAPNVGISAAAVPYGLPENGDVLIPLENVGAIPEDASYLADIVYEKNMTIVEMVSIGAEIAEELSLPDGWSSTPNGLRYGMVTSDTWDDIIVRIPLEELRISEGKELENLLLLVQLN